MGKRRLVSRWLKAANRIVIRLQSMGLALGTMHILSVPGRKSGQMRTTPVSLLTVDGQRYVVGGMIEADWVQNARAAGWGFLAHGRKGGAYSPEGVPKMSARRSCAHSHR